MENNGLDLCRNYPSVEKPWLKYYGRDFCEKDIPGMSIYQLIERENRNNLDDIAIDMRSSSNHFEKGITITYKKLFKAIRRSAKASYALGIKTDEIVPIILPNIPEARILIYSNSIIGATSYPISPMLPATQLERIIRENNIRNVFIFKDFFQKFKDVLIRSNIEHIVMLDGTESLPEAAKMFKAAKNLFQNDAQYFDSRIMSWHDYYRLYKHIAADITPYYSENHIAAIIGTSGTTGIPKGVCMSDININASAWSYKEGDLVKGTFLDALPPSIGYGIAFIHYQTVTGKYVYLIPELLTTLFPEALEKLKPDTFPGGPVHFINLLNSDLKNKAEIKGKYYVSGGAALPGSVEKI